MFCKKGLLKNSTNFTGKHLSWSLFLIKLQAFSIATLLKRDSSKSVFPVKFAKFLGTPTLKNICERLLLKIISEGQTWEFICSSDNVEEIFVHVNSQQAKTYSKSVSTNASE